MIWAILAAVGVPLWLCAAGILSLVLRNRRLRRREGDIPMRLRLKPEKRWTRGHALWAHDVLVFRGSPAMWSEELLATIAVSLREPTEQERKHLHRLGDAPVVAELTLDGEERVVAAAAREHRERLLGPYGHVQAAA